MDVVSIVSNEQKQELARLLGVSSKLNLTSKVQHTEGGVLVVGEKYEMYAPAAKSSGKALGITWHDDVHYAFTYLGTINMRGELYVCTADITYNGAVIPDVVLAQFKVLKVLLGGALPLCPAYVIGKIVRPYTGE